MLDSSTNELQPPDSQFIFAFILLQYIQYSKLKRIINRRKFIADQDEANAEAARKNGGKMSSSHSLTTLGNLAVPPINSFGEYTMLQPSSSGKSVFGDDEQGNISERGDSKYQDDESDFFKVILSEIEKVNKFFVG